MQTTDLDLAGSYYAMDEGLLVLHAPRSDAVFGYQLDLLA